jgi:hypothetical protein
MNITKQLAKKSKKQVQYIGAETWVLTDNWSEASSQIYYLCGKENVTDYLQDPEAGPSSSPFQVAGYTARRLLDWLNSQMCYTRRSYR